MTSGSSIVYVVPDKMGGMMNIIANLLAYRSPGAMPCHAILTHNRLHTDTRFGLALAADTQTTIEYTLPIENLHAVMRRIASAVPPGGGVLVAGDLLDLAVASTHDFRRAVIYMLHGDTDYYYELAVRHEPIVHAFIAYSRRMHQRLLELLPHRAATIFHLPYGIPIPVRARTARPGVLRAIFAGRLEQEQKGVFDLPEIDRVLRAGGVEIAWTVAGSGPDEGELRRRWADNPSIRWAGRLQTSALIAAYQDQDIFVLPTRHEGFPVALLEAMGAGLVPVVSDIESGVPEVVDTEGNGIRLPVGDVGAFAAAIAALAADPDRLEQLSAAARHSVASRFDIRDRVGSYESLYARWAELYHPVAGRHRLQYGSRLDQRWLPNPFVRFVRTALRASR